MTIRCKCDHCGAPLKVKDKLAGTERDCPKCREKILIPNVSQDDSEDVLLGDDPKSPEPAGPKKSAEEEEEEAIFGDDFFSLKEPTAQSRYVAPAITDDDDDDDEPVPRKKKPKSTETNVGAEINSGSGDNAALIASSLLSKTGKRNRPEDFKDPGAPEEVSYDYSEINYLLLYRVIPCVGAAVILFSFFYWLFAGMMGAESNLPELAELTGRVTNNGEVVAANLRFFPAAGTNGDAGFSGSSSFAFTDVDGQYEAFYADDVEGLVLGRHDVQISIGRVRVSREIIIEAGSQVIDFEIAE